MFAYGAQWLEHLTVNPEDQGSSQVAAISKLGQFRCLGSLSCINEHLALDSSGYVSDEHLALDSSGYVSDEHLALDSSGYVSDEHLALDSSGYVSDEHLALDSSGYVSDEHLALDSSGYVSDAGRLLLLVLGNCYVIFFYINSSIVYDLS